VNEMQVLIEHEPRIQIQNGSKQ